MTFEISHSSGSWRLLREDVVNKFNRLPKFEDAEARDLYFEISESKSKYIENEFQFNALVVKTEVRNKERVLPDLKVQVNGMMFLSRLGMKNGVDILILTSPKL